MNNVVLPAEWAPQSAVLMAWPHENSDWAYILEEVQSCFREIIAAITRFEKVVLIVPDNKVAEAFKSVHGNKVMPVVAATNDTWARDFGPLTVFKNGKPVCLDFKFNGWGLKFAADKDNLLNRELFNNNILHRDTVYENRLNFVLEGGAIESDGLGTLLTTSECLLSPNRNGQWSKTEIEAYLKEAFGLSRVLWVNNGYLSGDDTDSHIDTLARVRRRKTPVVAQKSDNLRIGARFFQQLFGLQQRHAHGFGFFRHLGFSQIAAGFKSFDIRARARRHQTPADQGDKGNAGQRHRHAHGAEIEHAKALGRTVLHAERRHDQVWRRADQRGHATQNGAEGDRHQQLAGHDALTLGDLKRHRHQKRERADVIHEG